MKKRILSLILCICIVVCLFPTAVFADGEASNIVKVSTSAEIIAAFANAKDGDIIELQDDITSGITTLQLSGTDSAVVTVEINDYRLISNGGSGIGVATGSNRTLVFTNKVVSATNPATLYSYVQGYISAPTDAQIVFKSGVFKCSNVSKYVDTNNATWSMNGVNLVVTPNIAAEFTPTAEVNGQKFISRWDFVNYVNSSKGVINATLFSDFSFPQSGTQFTNLSGDTLNLNLNGHSITTKNNTGGIFNLWTGGTVNIDGSKVGSGLYVNADSLNGSNPCSVIKSSTYANISVNINGGSYISNLGDWLYTYDSGDKGTFTITAGTFDADPSSYVDTANASITKVGDYWKVTPFVAKIGTTYYATLDEAVAAANDDDTIQLLGENSYSGLSITKNITIKGNVDTNGNLLSTVNSGFSVSGAATKVAFDSLHFTSDTANSSMRAVDSSSATANDLIVNFTNCKQDRDVLYLIAPSSKTTTNVTGCTIDMRDNFMLGYGAGANLTNNTFLNVVNSNYIDGYDCRGKVSTVTASGNTYHMAATASNPHKILARMFATDTFMIDEGTTFDLVLSDRDGDGFVANIVSAGTLNISGSLSGKTKGEVVYSALSTTGSGTISITGGTYGYNPADYGDNHINYVADGYASTANGDDTWTVAEASSVTYVAQIGDNKYETLAEAVAAIGELSGTTGTITMLANTVLTSTISIPSGYTVTLDLNGKEISGGDAVRIFDLSGNLTITDSSATLSAQGYETAAGTGKICNGASTSGAYGAAITMNNGSALTINAGSICNSLNTGSSGSGGVQVASGSTLTINGGSIKNCVTESGERSGGAIKLSGSLIMNGGEISGNTAQLGGGVFTSGKDAAIVINGGCVKNNKGLANSTAGAGGGIYVSDQGTLTIYDGTLSGNEVTGGNGNGAAVYAVGRAKVYLYGGTITQNTASNQGGGIKLCGNGYGNPTLTMTSGTISNNTATNNRGGGIMLEYANATISGGTISGNTCGTKGGGIDLANGGSLTITGGTITENTAGSEINGNAIEVVKGDSTTISIGQDVGKETVIDGSIKLTTANSASITDGRFSGKVIAGSSLGLTEFISGGLFTDAAKEGTDTSLLASGKAFVANTDTNTNETYPWTIGAAPVAEITKNETTTQYTSLVDAFAAAENGDTIKVIADCETTTITIDAEKSVTLDLNGHTVVGKVGVNEIAKETGTNFTSTDYAFRPVIYNKGTLVIDDSSTDKNGKIYNGTDTSAYVSISTGDYNDKNFISNWICLLNESTGSLTIKNGWFGDSTLGTCGNAVYNFGTAIIQGGNFTVGPIADSDRSNWKKSGYTFVNKSGAAMTVENCEIYGGNQRGAFNNSGTLTINKGTNIIGKYYYYLVINSGTTNINDGTFAYDTASHNSYNIPFYFGNSSFNILGGTFTHKNTGKSDNTFGISGTAKGIKGGTFDWDPSANVADGYEAVEKTTGTWTVQRKAEKQQTQAVTAPSDNAVADNFSIVITDKDTDGAILNNETTVTDDNRASIISAETKLAEMINDNSAVNDFTASNIEAATTMNEDAAEAADNLSQIKTALQTAVTDGTNDTNISDGNKAAANTTIGNMTATDLTSFVKVEATAAAVEQSNDANKTTTVKTMYFDVKPIVTTTVTDGDDKKTVTAVIPNNAITSPITFRLPIDSNIKDGTIVEVYHQADSDDEKTLYGAYPVQTETVSNVVYKFVELSASSFSIYSYDLVASTEYCDITASLTLGENIDINLGISNLKSGTVLGNYSVEATFNGTTIKYSLSDVTADKDGIYSHVIANVVARQMTDTVAVKVYYGADDKKTVIKEFSYSVREYCKTCVDNNTEAASGSKAEKLVTLCKAVLDYGTYAQMHFGYNTKNLANADGYGNTLSAVPSDVNKTALSGDWKDVENIKASLVLNSEITLKFIFYMESGSSLGGSEVSSVTMDGVEITNYTVSHDNGDIYNVRITGIKATDLRKTFAVSILANGTITYSPYSYAYRNQDVTTDSLGNLCKAIYAYGEAAYAYATAN